MGNSKNSELCRCKLIDDAVMEATKNVSSTSATEFRSKQGIRQDEIRSSFEFGHKREAKLDVCLQGIKRCGVM